MDVTTLVLAGAVTNRIVEVVKTLLEGVPQKFSDAAVLVLACVVGFVFVLAFPGLNVFAGQGASPLAETIGSGIVIAATAGVIQFGADGANKIVTASAARITPH